MYRGANGQFNLEVTSRRLGQWWGPQVSGDKWDRNGGHVLLGRRLVRGDVEKRTLVTNHIDLESVTCTIHATAGYSFQTKSLLITHSYRRKTATTIFAALCLQTREKWKSSFCREFSFFSVSLNHHILLKCLPIPPFSWDSSQSQLLLFEGKLGFVGLGLICMGKRHESFNI